MNPDHIEKARNLGELNTVFRVQSAVAGIFFYQIFEVWADGGLGVLMEGAPESVTRFFIVLDKKFR